MLHITSSPTALIGPDYSCLQVESFLCHGPSTTAACMCGACALGHCILYR
eukprot:m.205486 g.205486  ORF g.205486 m.205486 type:complete len:50 (-) comp15015_c0_seq12:1309-1458(-)